MEPGLPLAGFSLRDRGELVRVPAGSRQPRRRFLGSIGHRLRGLGVLLAASIRSLPTHLRAIAEEHRRWSRNRRVRRFFKFDRKSPRTLPGLLCIAVLISFLVPIFTNTRMFLSAGPGVDVIAHGLGFLFGFIGAMVLFAR